MASRIRASLQAMLRVGLILLLSGTATSAAEIGPSADELMQRGLSAAEQGALEQALVAWKAAAQLYDRAGQARGHIQALSHAAYAARALGHINQAFLQQELALQLARKMGDPTWLTLTLSELGKTYVTSHQYDTAADYLSQAAEIAHTRNLRTLSASLQNDLGIVLALQGRFQEALAAFEDSAARATEENLRILFVRARVNAARVTMQLARFDEAAAALSEADNRLSATADSHNKADGLINLALGYRDLATDRPDEHVRWLKRSAALLQEAAAMAEESGGKRLASYAYGHLGHLYERERRLDEALQLTRRAVFAAQSAGAPESLYRWQWQSGRLLTRLGNLDHALSAYQEAAATLQPIRAEVAFSSQTSLDPAHQSIRSLYFELADLLLQRAALMTEEAEADSYLKAARDAIEAYKAAELRDYFRDDCVDQMQARLTKLDAVSPATAIIYPIMFSDRTELLVSFPDGLRRHSVPVTASALTAEIRSFRRMLEKRTTREYLPHAQQLYDWLLRPLLADLRRLKVNTLVFVPDGPLRTIPMSALHDGHQFLIAQYAVAMTPGLDLTDPRPIDRTRAHLLSSGLTQAVQGFPPLPHVAEEMAHLNSLFKGEQLLDSNFVTPRLEGELKDGRYSILHIATHGRFATDVNQSFLLTFDDRLTMTQLERLVGLLRFRQDPLELLTLSACQTGIGDDRAALGLAGIAVKAGARSALATLWFINDEASSELVSEFYRQLHDSSISKAHALQLAQLKLLSGRLYEHPAYWSAFLLLNNWL
ncbi:MAG TPA: CHAT domain-containing protein [Nitrospira sp.]|nr:CHAT domain-containing protein [Nitrospira sp.]